MANPIVCDDDLILADIALNISKLVECYPVSWSPASGGRKADNHATTKERLINEVVAPLGSKEYSSTDFMRVTRLAPATLPLRFQLQNECLDKYQRIVVSEIDVGMFLDKGAGCVEHQSEYSWPVDSIPEVYPEDSRLPHHSPVCGKIVTEVIVKDCLSSYMNEETHRLQSDKAKYVVEWYVAFTDHEIFSFNESPSRFASEEILVLEHPCLSNLRRCLQHLSDKGVLAKAANGKSPLIENDIHFYLAKDKSTNDFRSQELALMSRDYAGLPTPYLFMGVPMLAKLSPKKLYGADISEAYDSVEKCTLPLNGGSRPRHNVISMSAPDRLANPLRPRTGPYTIYQIRHIFRTAYTAFRGATLKSKETWLCLKQEVTKTKTTRDSVAINFQPSSGPSIKETSKLIVAVHTGHWGTGEFQNNKQVMAYCQIAAARLAGVNELFYHVPNEGEVLQIKMALDWVDEAFNGASDSPLVESVLKHLCDKKLQWQESK
ncbi:hypothetical protein BC830DRAFT_1105882 [Chytriomyces sp. MP71]|nr:hypothetical protein BC830DRAFT_1105882 [Chytriomyces sp. MP71]